MTLNKCMLCVGRLSSFTENSSRPLVLSCVKEKEELSLQVKLRPNKYLNNRVELRTHRFIQRLVKLKVGFGAFTTARAFNKRIRNSQHEPERTN